MTLQQSELTSSDTDFIEQIHKTWWIPAPINILEDICNCIRETLGNPFQANNWKIRQLQIDTLAAFYWLPWNLKKNSEHTSPTDIENFIMTLDTKGIEDQQLRWKVEKICCAINSLRFIGDKDEIWTTIHWLYSFPFIQEDGSCNPLYISWDELSKLGFKKS